MQQFVRIFWKSNNGQNDTTNLNEKSKFEFFSVLNYIFYDYWKIHAHLKNLLNTTVCMLCIIYTYAQLSQLIYPIQVISSFALMTGVIYILFFLRNSLQTGPLVYMIYKVVYDFSKFLFIMIIFLCAYSFSTYMVQDKQITLVRMFQFQYRLILGDVDEFFHSTQNDFMISLYFHLSTFIIVIILMNFLIAILNDTYSQIKEDTMVTDIKQKIDVIQSRLQNNLFILDQQCQKKQETRFSKIIQVITNSYLYQLILRYLIYEYFSQSPTLDLLKKENYLVIVSCEQKQNQQENKFQTEEIQEQGKQSFNDQSQEIQDLKETIIELRQNQETVQNKLEQIKQLLISFQKVENK